MRSFRQSFLRLLTITTIANKGQELFNIFRQFLASVGTSFFDLRYFCFCNGLKKYLFHSVRTKNVYNGSARYQMKSEPSRDYGTMTVYLWFRRPNAHGKLKKKKNCCHCWRMPVLLIKCKMLPHQLANIRL